MALSPAEKQKRYRERKKEKEAQDSIGVEDTFKAPFYSFFSDEWFGSNFHLGLELAGIAPPAFDDDTGAAEHSLYDAPQGDADPIFYEARDSLGRAEFMIGCLADAAADLAQHVNEYKRSEIKQRLTEIEERDLSDPEVKKAALQEATRLNKMLDQLSKQVRITFPQWKATV